jgi:Dolichyl-phosphate-mannose-protein mannosyltransferase
MSVLTKDTNPVQPDASALGLLGKLERLTEKLAPVLMPVLILLFSVWSWFASREIRFWFDELLELLVASAPTSHDLMVALAAGDHNPPLSHYLIRASMSLFGGAEWAARLPPFLGMVTLLVCIYFFVSRWLTPVYGIAAMLVLICSPVRIYATQARPYGLVLGFSALALLFYQQAVKPGRRFFALAGLSVCTACLAATHYYAVLVIVSVLPVELMRTWRTRRPDWILLVCGGAPPLIVLAMLWKVIREQKAQLAHYFARGNLLSFAHGYDILDMDPMIYCVALVAITLLLSLYFADGFFPAAVRVPSELDSNENLEFAHTGLLGASLLFLPILGAFFTQFITHAYLTRYFSAAAIGLTMCVCFSVRLFSRVVPGIVVIVILSLGLGFGKALMQQAHRLPGSLPAGAAIDAGTSPILFDNPDSYLQIYQYFPGLRPKIWVIADPDMSLRYRQYDTDDQMMLALASARRIQAISLKEAVRKWPHFSMIPRAVDHVWALQCLIDSGTKIAITNAFGNSNFVFDITVPPESLPRIDACYTQQ